MKKVLAIFSVLAFLGVYAAPALTMPQDVAAKIVTVDKDKKKATAVKSEAKSGEKAAACCSEKVAASGEKAAAGCCSEAKAADCKMSAACKGEGKTEVAKETQKK